MEEIRNLSYSNIAPGNPSETPPYKNNTLSDTVTTGNVSVSRIVTVQPVDDAWDGIGGADIDADIQDYKK